MEIENISIKPESAYDLVSKFTPENFDNTNELNEISIDGIRKHYYLDILAASYNTGEIILWNTRDCKQNDTIKLFPGYIGDMQWFLDNSIFASSGNDFLLFDLEKKKEIKRFKGHSNPIWSLKPLLGSNVIASAGSDKIIILWDVRDSKPFNVILAHSLTINSLDFSSNKEYLMSAGGDGYCRIWSLFNSKAIKTLMVDHTVYLTSAKFSFNAKYVLVSSLKNTLTLFDLETSEIVMNYVGHTNSQYFIESSFGFIDGNQKFIVSGSEDGKICMWDAQSGKVILDRTISEENGVARAFINEYSENSNELYINILGEPIIQYYKSN